MGCGSSTAQSSKPEQQAPPPAKTQEAQQENHVDKGVKDAPPAVSPPLGSTEAECSPTTNSQCLTWREKFLPGPLFVECQSDDGPFLISSFDHVGDNTGLTIACRSGKTREVFAVALSEDDIHKHREGLGSPEWKNFWRSLATALQHSSRLNVSNGGARIDFKFKGGKEAKDGALSLELTPLGSSPEVAYTHFVEQFPRLCSHRLKAAGDSDSKITENDFLKKEAQLALSESLIIAADMAEQHLLEAGLREAARKAQREVGKQERRIAKMRQQLEEVERGVPSHPLDEMYDCNPPEGGEWETVDITMLRWDTDVESSLIEVACTVFSHHGLLEHFNIPKDLFVRYWRGIELRCRDLPYHGAQRAADMMAVMHFLLEALTKVIKLDEAELFGALMAAGILDVNHEGVDNTFIKRAGSMLSMLYSDLYAVGQNALTTAFEVMFNPHMNLFADLNTDTARDITEIVREAIYIKANVQMKSPEERAADFSDVPDKAGWNKDNIRLVITQALRVCDWCCYLKPHDLHRKWVDRLAKEFYGQGERETALGLAPSNFYGTVWTTDSSRSKCEFAAGQVEILDTIVIPALKELIRIAPELEPLMAQAQLNRAAWQGEGGDSLAKVQSTLESVGKAVAAAGAATAHIRPGPDAASLWVTATCAQGTFFSARFSDEDLQKKGTSISALSESFRDDPVKTTSLDKTCCVLEVGGIVLELPSADGDGIDNMLGNVRSYVELRKAEKPRDIDKKVDEYKERAAVVGKKGILLEGEEKALRGCIMSCDEKVEKNKPLLKELEERVERAGGNPNLKLQIEDALAIKVRNPLKAPLPPGVTKPPDRKDVDLELLKLLKSQHFTEDKEVDEKAPHCNVILPYLSSEFAQVTSKIDDANRQKIYDLVQRLDEWDYDVFALQEAMSGGISGEYLRNQPNGGALFITMYALCFKWQFMQKFNIDESTLLNWLSIVEAGYHPNPYHNSMHAADVLHVTHYILGPGGCKSKAKASDEEVFAALFAAAIHDYNHPGINNAFHVRSQNYLAVLFNDRSVNENIHASSVFELMRMDEFNILKAFQGDSYTTMRDDIVEFVLGTDMGLHTMFVTRFKKRVENDSAKMHKSKADRNLTLTMAVKMADISNCGRPKRLYHNWCNVIVDEFYQQGDRERLHGMPVSPYMDRYTTVMSKGQIGFMNYIVMPLFECMGEFLPNMAMAAATTDENKAFWQDNEDW